MSTRSAHVDTFTGDHLPARDEWPELIFTLPELRYPERLNCGAVLLDEAIEAGCGDLPAIWAESLRWSYAELRNTVDRIAHVLTREMGVVPGNRVLLRAPNSPWLAAAWLAVMKAGAVAVTSVPMLRAKELHYMGDKARIDFALCDHRLIDELKAAAASGGRYARILTFGDGQLEALMQKHGGAFEAVDTAGDDVCILAFTSGTTGNAKATMHFHRDVLAVTDIVGKHLLHTRSDDIYLGSPPLGFTFGLGALLVFPLRFRASTVMLEKASPAALLQAVQQFRATGLFTAPTMYRNLAALSRAYDLSSLRTCVSAGEALSKSTFDLWQGSTGLALIDGIGSTEMLHIFIGASGDAIRPGATGKVLPGYEACVLGDDDRPLAPGNTGRLAVRGPTGCRYLDDARQRGAVAGGWNLTGDRYTQDEDGYFWFQGRADDLIVSSGYNISAVEVEEVLNQHPQVLECAVVAAPDTERGNVVKAFIVLRGEAAAPDTLIKELQEFVKSAIAPYKYPRAIEFVGALPKTPTGKIRRAALREPSL